MRTARFQIRVNPQLTHGAEPVIFMNPIDKRKQTRVQPAGDAEDVYLKAVERDFRGLKTLNKMQLELIRHLERLFEDRDSEKDIQTKTATEER